MPERYTKKYFIEISRKIHNNKYDYSKVIYINSKTPVEIICPTHGSFLQTPNNHRHRGCQKCAFQISASKHKKSTKYFVQKANKIHKYKYNYSLVNYNNYKEHVKIICPIHGIFEQIPSNHLKHGCNQCSHETIANKERKNVNTFVAEAKKIHEDKYRYNKVYYKNAHTKIEILCKKHGSFFQTPNAHLRGQNCPLCSKEQTFDRFLSARRSWGYRGLYKDNVFRSMYEFFWMLYATENKIDFIGLDQSNMRKQWQVQVLLDNKNCTYCADFFIIKENKVIDIKPLYRLKISREKLKIEQGRAEYRKKGYNFEIVDCNSIRVDMKEFIQFFDNKKISLCQDSVKRLEKRRKKLGI